MSPTSRAETLLAAAVGAAALLAFLLGRRTAPMDPRAPACVRALQDATERWPSRNRASDGIMGDAAHQARPSDHNIGNAVDVTHDPAGCHGDIIAGHAISDGRARYVVWNRRIDHLDGLGWRPYTGTHPHTSHVHISIKPELRADRMPWGWIDPSLDEAAAARGRDEPPPARDTLPSPPPYADDDDEEGQP